jgi:diketogulonate reductase-like aldo/keto reductase
VTDEGQGNEQLNRQQRIAAWKVLEDLYHQGWARAIGVSNFAPKKFEQQAPSMTGKHSK